MAIFAKASESQIDIWRFFTQFYQKKDHHETRKINEIQVGRQKTTRKIFFGRPSEKPGHTGHWKNNATKKYGSFKIFF